MDSEVVNPVEMGESNTDVSSSGSDSNSYVEAAPVTEKMLPQSEVNKIIGKVRSDAESKAYERAKAQYQPPNQSQTLGGQKIPTQQDIQRMIDEGVEKRAQQAYAEQLVNDFTGKIKAGSNKYQDFDQVVGDLNLASNPHLVRWTNGLDNTSDVLYDLGKYPEKYASVMTLAATAPNLAVKKLQELSDSIKRNEEAKNTAKKAAEPLDSLEPSVTGMDNGNLTVSDYRKLDWLRG